MPGVQERGMTSGQFHALAWRLANDSELRGLEEELAELELEMDAAERAIPEHVRDIDTIEADVLGYLEDDGREPCEVRTEIRTAIRQFAAEYRSIETYGQLVVRKRNLHRKIDARKQQLGVPAPN